MASKESTIKTIFALDGEQKYKEALSQINNENKTLRSEMKLLAAQYATNGDKSEFERGKIEILNKQLELQRQKVEEANNAMAQAERLYGSNSGELEKYKRDLNYAEAGLQGLTAELERSRQALSEEESALIKAGAAAEAAGQKISKVGESMERGGAALSKAITVPLVAVGAAASAAWLEVDEAYDSIIKMTGATGAAAESLQESLRNVATSLPGAEISKTAQAVGELNTQFGLTGTELENTATNLLKFSEISNSDVVNSIQGAKKALELFGMTAEDLPRVLDAVAKASQDTGQSVESIFGSIATNAPTLQRLNLDFEESAYVLSRLEQSGINADKALGYLSKASIVLAQDGKTLQEGLAELQDDITNSTSETESLTLAAKLFGQKGANEMLKVIAQGKLDFKEFASAAEETAGTVANTFDATIDPLDHWKTAINDLTFAGADLGEKLQIALAPVIEGITSKVKALTEWFKELNPETQEMIIKTGLYAAALGPLLSIGGKVVSSIGDTATAIGKLIKKFGAMTAAKAAADNLDGLAGAAGETSKVIGLSSKVGLWGAVAGLAIVLGVTLYNSFTAVNPETEKFRNELSRLNEELSNSSNTAKDAATNYQGAMVNMFALLEKENKSAGDKAKLTALVKELNALYPELNLQYSVEADALSKSKDAIDGYVESSIAKEQLTKLEEGYLEALTKVAEAEQNLLETKQKQAEAQEALSRATDEQQAHVAAAELSNLNVLYNEQVETLTIAKDTLGEYSTQIDGTSEQVAKLAESTVTTNAALAESDEAVKASAAALEESAERKREAVAKLLGEVEQLTEQNYQKMGSIAQGAAEQSALTAAQVEENLKAQIAQFQNHHDVITELAGKVPPDVMEELKKLPLEYTPYLTELNGMTESGLQDHVEIYREKASLSAEAALEELGRLPGAAGENAAETIAAVVSAFAEKHPDLKLEAEEITRLLLGELDKPKEQAREKGEQTISNHIDGMKSKKPELQAELDGLKKDVANALDNAAQQATPKGGEVVLQTISGLMSRHPELAGALEQIKSLFLSMFGQLVSAASAAGGNIGAGLAGGMAGSAPAVSQAAGGLSGAVTNTLKQGLMIRSPSKVMEQLGGFVAEGFALGIADKAKLVRAETDKLTSVNLGTTQTGRVNTPSNQSQEKSTGDKYEINITVPTGETEEFGRKTGAAFIAEMRRASYAKGHSRG